MPALAEIRDLDTLNAELGFGELQTAEGDEDRPSLAVVGGTEHATTDQEPESLTLAEAAEDLEQRAVPDGDGEAECNESAGFESEEPRDAFPPDPNPQT